MDVKLFAVFLIIIIITTIIVYILSETREPFSIIGTIGTQNILSDAARVAYMLAEAKSIPEKNIQTLIEEKKEQERKAKEKTEKEKEAKEKEEKEKQDSELQAIKIAQEEEEADKSRPLSYLQTLMQDLKTDLQIVPSSTFYYNNIYERKFIRNKLFSISILADNTITENKYAVYQLQFDNKDLSANIVNAFFKKEDESSYLSLHIYKFYDNFMDKNSDNIKLFAYQECAELIRNLRKIKNSIDSVDDINIQIARLTTQEKTKFQTTVDKFAESYIYGNLKNTDNPLNNLNMSYATYIESIKTKNKNYDLILPELTRTLQTDKKYSDVLLFQKDILVYLNIHTKAESYLIAGIYNAVKEDGSCFQENMGAIDVEMRPCTLHFTDYYDSCEKFGELYKLSPMQLQILIYRNAQVFQNVLMNHSYTVYLYDDVFLTLIELYERYKVLNFLRESPEKLNNWHIPHLRFFIKKRANIQTTQYDTAIDIFCKKVWSDIFNLKVSYKGKQYFCYDVSVVRKRKMEDPNIQLCKIEMNNEMKEIHKIHGDDKEFERKLYNYKYSNKSELWGACFYSVKKTENVNQVVDDYLKTYGLTTLCPEKPVLTNIKCKDGCPSNNEDRYVAFHIEPIGNDISPFLMNPHLKINDSAIFLKISINYLNWSADFMRTHNVDLLNKHNCQFSISFVKFNNQTKEFYTFQDIHTINQLLKNNFYTLMVDNNSVYLVPNRTTKRFFVCSFYNKKVYEYSVLDNSFSLSDFAVQNVDLNRLAPSNGIYKQLVKNRGRLRCNNENHFNNMLACINNLVAALNADVLTRLNSQRLSLEGKVNAYTNDVNYYQGQINLYTKQLNDKNTEAYFCDSNNPIHPHASYWINFLENLINNNNNALTSKRNYLNRLRYDEEEIRRNINWNAGIFSLFSNAYHAIRLDINLKKQSETNNEIASITSTLRTYNQSLSQFKIKCDNTYDWQNWTKQHLNNLHYDFNRYSSYLNKTKSDLHNINAQIQAMNAGNSVEYIKNVESYHINNYNFHKNHMEKLINQYLQYEIMQQYLYGSNIFISNDNCMYIEIS